MLEIIDLKRHRRYSKKKLLAMGANLADKYGKPIRLMSCYGYRPYFVVGDGDTSIEGAIVIARFDPEKCLPAETGLLQCLAGMTVVAMGILAAVALLGLGESSRLF